MPDTKKQTLREEYTRLKKVFEKIIQPKKKKQLPQLVLQPYRNMPNGRRLKNFEGY